jgi:hypothetical protein
MIIDEMNAFYIKSLTMYDNILYFKVFRLRRLKDINM